MSKDPEHGPNCHCGIDEAMLGFDNHWEAQAAATLVGEAMFSLFQEEEAQRSAAIRAGLKAFIEETDEREADFAQTIMRVSLLIARMIVTVAPIVPDSPPGEVEDEQITEAVMVDRLTGEEIIDPDAEANTAAKVAGLAASRLVAAMNDDNFELAVDILNTLPDPEVAMTTLFMLTAWAGRVSMEEADHSGALTPAGRARLDQIRAQEQAQDVKPEIIRNPQTGRDFIRLPKEEMDDETVAQVKAQSRGPAVYAMSIIDPSEDQPTVAADAHREMLGTTMYEGYLCEHLHHEAVSEDQVLPTMRAIVSREVRRRQKMLGRESVILLSWRHLVECHGQDVIPDPDVPVG